MRKQSFDKVTKTRTCSQKTVCLCFLCHSNRILSKQCKKFVSIPFCPKSLFVKRNDKATLRQQWLQEFTIYKFNKPLTIFFCQKSHEKHLFIWEERRILLQVFSFCRSLHFQIRISSKGLTLLFCKWIQLSVTVGFSTNDQSTESSTAEKWHWYARNYFHHGQLQGKKWHHSTWWDKEHSNPALLHSAKYPGTPHQLKISWCSGFHHQLQTGVPAHLW